MRILILSGNTGGGHNSAANAVKTYFESIGSACVIKDALAFWSERKSYIISNGHIYIYKKVPRLFGVMYRFEEKHPAKENNNSFMYELVTKGAGNLYKYLLTEKFDAVVSTHVFASMIVTEVKKKYIPSLRSYFIATDYTCSPGVSELIGTNRYFIPHERLVSEFVENRIEKSLICPAGIPVNPKFYKKTPPDTAKISLALPATKKTVLLMCGSMGCGPIKKLAQKLCAALPENAHLVAVCGNNKKLYSQLKNTDFENITVVGFTDRISDYMDAAEVILTKAGGLSTTEALTKHLPIILIDAVPGCETRNRDFLIANNFAKSATNIDSLVTETLRYITDENLLNAQKALLEKEFNKNAPKIIYDEIYKDLMNETVQL